jgi:hypothetical protein
MAATGNQPYDQNSVALAILGNTATQMSKAMLPVAEISPMGSVISNYNVALASSASQSQGISIQWPCNGFIVGIRASTEDGLAASMAGVLLRVQVNGQDELFPSASGQGAGYLPLVLISGNGAAFGRYAVRRAFQQANNWAIYLNNTTTGNITVDIAFDYINTSTPRS